MDEKVDSKLVALTSASESKYATGEVIEVIRSPITGKEFEITKDVDEAMKYALFNEEGHIELDEVTARKLLWKIDLYVLPVMCLLYCFQFMDKLSNSWSAILGLRTELHMVGDQYAWTGTAFYLGYLAFEFPASYMLQKLPLAKTVSVIIVLWGMILCCHSATEYAGFVALRTILGALELSVTPAFTIITAQWYTQLEQFVRISFWFACNGLGQILGGAIAYGLAKHQESYAIDAWKLIFIITGCLTIFLGFVVFFHIPDTPHGAWFLTDTEKALVVERIRVNQQGFGNKYFKKYQFLEAFTDYKTWLIFVFSLSNNIPNGGITNFGSILLKEDFGFSTLDSLLMSMPSGAVELVGCILFALISRAKFIKSRMAMAVFSAAVTLMSECLLAFAPLKKARLAGYILYSLGPVGFICMISLVALNVAGHTKKVTTNAILLIGYCIGNIIGPQTFIDTQAPQYHGAKVAIVICGSVCLLMLVLIWIAYIWENKKKEKLRAEHAGEELGHNQEFADLTDGENIHFVYQT